METNSRTAVLESLQQLRLMEFDWDGVQGLPLRGDVADNVSDVYEGGVDLLLEDLAEHLPMPVVSLNPNGTIEVLYKDPDSNRELVITFQAEGVLTYVKLFDDGQTMVEGVIRVNLLSGPYEVDLSELKDLFDWLASE
ncbi:hypothetical protein SAMN05444166_4210 [Singulisphaera sp. GP187]|uniref:hypothetical protein n=1 Tax=Singulisphaera sp. GP187 TaxID=1882752 RepID=UPI00092AC1C4|nr:hypothetical protein [Singulisphaera sp. GP187]SIO37695.1 hypothetical protein SAMN05444166_4210 [Singulisphaera sp. GP187]